MRTISQKFAAVLLVTLCLLGTRFSMAHDGSHQEDWVDVGGNVRVGEIPVCALVLINGQTQFSCDGTGRYDMNVPVDDNGMITVQVYADGFAPFNQIVTPDQAAAFPIDMLLDQNSPSFQVTTSHTPSGVEGRFVVSGTVKIGITPVCALVLANGQNMFSCNENLGQFSLDVPIDPDGNITLFVYAAGFKPYKTITNVVLDSDQDGIKDYLDYDDDNDGIMDVDDTCPQVSGSDCNSITDTIMANGKEWAQVILFTNLSWDEINAVCPGPAGACVNSGVLNGYDMTGWTWASTDDVNTLFNFYGVNPPLGYDPLSNLYWYSSDLEEFAAVSWFADGWRETNFKLVEDGLITIIVTAGVMRGSPSGMSPLLGSKGEFIVDRFTDSTGPWTDDWFISGSANTDQPVTSSKRDEGIGGWFYRNP